MTWGWPTTRDSHGTLALYAILRSMLSCCSLLLGQGVLSTGSLLLHGMALRLCLHLQTVNEPCCSILSSMQLSHQSRICMAGELHSALLADPSRCEPWAPPADLLSACRTVGHACMRGVRGCVQATDGGSARCGLCEGEQPCGLGICSTCRTSDGSPPSAATRHLAAAPCAQQNPALNAAEGAGQLCSMCAHWLDALPSCPSIFQHATG